MDEVRHRDHYPRTDNTDGADEQPNAVFLAGEHMLDRRADSGALSIGPRDVLGDRPTRYGLPAHRQIGAPIILVSTDRQRAFEMTAAGQLVDRPVSRPSRVKEGVERA